MKYIFYFFSFLSLCSCWKIHGGAYNNNPRLTKVWGNKPVYSAETEAKVIQYISGKQQMVQAGNIYVKGRYIYQMDVGRGIHVMDNSNPSAAERIGLIKVNGCAQISIKGIYLYTNSYSDLVTLDISNPMLVKEINRVANAFPDYRNNYPLAHPQERGYYQCPQYDSVVIAWVKDSIYPSCYK